MAEVTRFTQIPKTLATHQRALGTIFCCLEILNKLNDFITTIKNDKESPRHGLALVQEDHALNLL